MKITVLSFSVKSDIAGNKIPSPGEKQHHYLQLSKQNPLTQKKRSLKKMELPIVIHAVLCDLLSKKGWDPMKTISFLLLLLTAVTLLGLPAYACGGSGGDKSEASESAEF